MDVQDVKAVKPAEIPPTQKSQDREPSKDEAHVSRPEVTVDIHSKSSTAAEMVSGLNKLIGTTNLVTKAADELHRYVKGIKGIVDQADNDLPPGRISLLEQEANQLVSAIKETIHVRADDGIEPLSGDQIEVQLEQQLGRSLQIILPDLSKDSLGLGDIKLSNTDFILSTRAMVRRSEVRLRELSEAVAETQKRVRGVADEVDIALQNAEASKSTIRDVEFALRSAGDTGTQIGENPVEALGSVGTLDPQVVGLLSAD